MHIKIVKVVNYVSNCNSNYLQKQVGRPELAHKTNMNECSTTIVIRSYH